MLLQSNSLTSNWTLYMCPIPGSHCPGWGSAICSTICMLLGQPNFDVDTTYFVLFSETIHMRTCDRQAGQTPWIKNVTWVQRHYCHLVWNIMRCGDLRKTSGVKIWVVDYTRNLSNMTLQSHCYSIDFMPILEPKFWQLRKQINAYPRWQIGEAAHWHVVEVMVLQIRKPYPR